MIVPFPAGGGSTDTLARIVAERHAATLGQPVIIENVGGAGGTIGVGRVARAAPDGYTVDLGQWTSHVDQRRRSMTLTFDLLKDLDAGLDDRGHSAVADRRRRTLPANNLKELIAWLKANPDKADGRQRRRRQRRRRSAGIYFQQNTGTKFKIVPYRGGGADDAGPGGRPDRPD